MGIIKKCVYCGQPLPISSQLYKRKYCSKTCGNKHKLRLKKPEVQAKLWQHETETFKSAMEMYWSGLGGAAISRHFGIPVGTIYSWIHDFGALQVRPEPPTIILPTKKSIKEQFQTAKTADEWLEILKSSEIPSEKSETVILVCKKLHGGGAPGRYVSIAAEQFWREDFCEGACVAFCNILRNAITTIEWHGENFQMTRTFKVSGTFVWPDEKLGKSIEVTRAEFDKLISIKKYNKIVKKP